MSEFSIRRPIAVLMFYLAIILLGIVSFVQLPLDFLPNLSFPKLTVLTTYSAASPQEVERAVSQVLEEAVSTVPNVRRITSTSREGVSVITMEFIWGTKMDFAMLEVREKLDKVRWLLPESAGRPTILAYDPQSQPIISLVVSSNSKLQVTSYKSSTDNQQSSINNYQLKEFSQNVIKRRLEQVKGVASATITGGVEKEIQIELDPALLSAYHLNIDDITYSLSQSNISLPGGSILQGRFRYPLRIVGEFNNIEEIGKITIKNPSSDATIYLSQIAKIKDTFKERDNITRYNGKEVLGILIQKESGTNTVQVSKEVKKIIKQLSKEYPDVSIITAFEQSEFIEKTIQGVIYNILSGSVLAFLVLLLFLHDFKNIIIITLSIPISIIATFILLYFGNVTLNIMSLGGLAVGVGLMVDDSIVVLENIFRHKQMNKDGISASCDGAREVTMVVIASALTTVVVFLPIVYVHGVAGQLFRDEALTITFALLTSMIVSLTLLPMLASKFMNVRSENKIRAGDYPPPEQYDGWKFNSQPSIKTSINLLKIPIKLILLLLRLIFRFIIEWLYFLISAIGKILSFLLSPIFNNFDRYYEEAMNYYKRFLIWSLDHKKIVLIVAMFFMILSIVLGYSLKRELMPDVDQGEFSISVKLPPGSSLHSTSKTVEMIENYLLTIPNVERVLTNIGISKESGDMGEMFIQTESSLNTGRIYIKLKKSSSTEEVIRKIDQKLQNLSDVVITYNKGQSILQQILGVGDSDIAIKVQGSYIETNAKIASALADSIKNIKGISNVHTNWQAGSPEIEIVINRNNADKYNISIRNVADFISNFFKGKIATQYKEFDKETDILVRLPESYQNDLRNFLNTSIPLSNNRSIPIKELVTYRYTVGPSVIEREDQQRQVVVYSNLSGNSLQDVLPKIEKQIFAISNSLNYSGMKDKYRVVISGMGEEMKASFKSLIFALLLASVLTYMIMAAQFESLKHPLVIMLTLPLSVVGLVIGLFIMKQSLNVMSLIGIIILVGIVVDNAIILIDFANQRRKDALLLQGSILQKRNTVVREAIVSACVIRMRPILITTLTTLLALIPMSLGIGEGSEMSQPLAISIIGGLTSSTLLTLVIIPVMYELVEGS